MLRIFLLLLIVILGAQSPIASFPPGMFANRNDPFVITYTGPGDIQSGATAFYSFRAYSGSYAAPGTHVAANINRTADNHKCDLLLAPSGGLGNTVNCTTGGDNGQTALSWIGTDSTCTGTISSTTLSCTSASSTPTANTSVSGAGIVGLYIVSCGTFTAGSGTCTLNAPPASNIGTPELITMVKNATIVTWYDQSGNGFDGTLTFVFNPIGVNGTLPTLLNGTVPASVSITAGNITYITSVAARQVNLTSQQAIISQFDSGNNPSGTTLQWLASTNTVNMYGGDATFTATASDLTLHGLQGVNNTTLSVINVDGTETTGSTNGTGAAPAHMCIAAAGGLCNTLGFNGGSLSEAGVWLSTTPNGTVRTSMCNNIRTYWGTPGSC